MGLDPLPDESLTGYLLRLSYRLGISPGHLATITGLSHDRTRGWPNGLPIKLLVDLKDHHLSDFAATTRLSEREVAGLCISSLAIFEGAPWPRGYRAGAAVLGHAFHNRWLFSARPRYCPPCLAGDETPIQTQLGGPWKKHWYLPAVFACLTHQRLLHHACPADDDHRFLGDALMRVMIGKVNDAAAHPTQCRQTTRKLRTRSNQHETCGASLADPPAEQQPGDMLRELLHLQRDLLADIDTPGRIPSVADIPVANSWEYFNDLGIVSALVLLSWPEARPLCLSPELAQEIETESRLRLLIANDPDHHWRTSLVTSPWTAAPLQARTSAAIFAVARKILTLPTLNDVAYALAPMIDRARTTNLRATEGLRNNKRRSRPLGYAMSGHPVRMPR